MKIITKTTKPTIATQSYDKLPEGTVFQDLTYDTVWIKTARGAIRLSDGTHGQVRDAGHEIVGILDAQLTVKPRYV